MTDFMAARLSDVRNRLRDLQALRLRLHRLDPSRPLRTARQAAAFIAERGVVMATGRSSLPLLTEAIAGRALAGSWMAHPEVYRIHEIFCRLSDRDALSVPLVLGKHTLLHPSLGPALERVAGDPKRRKRARSGLTAGARRLLEEVDSRGQVRLDRWGAPTRDARAARTLLERELLVFSSELHTEAGYHTVVLRPWRKSEISRRFSKRTGRLAYEGARDRLLLAALRSAVIAPESEVKKWFGPGADRFEAWVVGGKVERIEEEGRAWLTCADFATKLRSP